MRLDELSDINLGFPFRGRIPEVPGGAIAAVQMKNVSPGAGVDWARCVATELDGRRKPDWLQAGDILFVARGSRNYATLVDSSVPDRQAVAAPHFYVIRCTSKQVLPDFLAWQINHGPCQRYFEREAEGTLTKSIRRSVIAQTAIVVPPLETQQSIVGLANTLRYEQQTMEQLIRNGHLLMANIANDLADEAAEHDETV